MILSMFSTLKNLQLNAKKLFEMQYNNILLSYLLICDKTIYSPANFFYSFDLTFF